MQVGFASLRIIDGKPIDRVVVTPTVSFGSSLASSSHVSLGHKLPRKHFEMAFNFAAKLWELYVYKDPFVLLNGKQLASLCRPSVIRSRDIIEIPSVNVVIRVFLPVVDSSRKRPRDAAEEEVRLQGAFIVLIAEAILKSQTQRCSYSDIISHVCDRHEHYRNNSEWQSALRQALSNNRYFVRANEGQKVTTFEMFP